MGYNQFVGVSYLEMLSNMLNKLNRKINDIEYSLQLLSLISVPDIYILGITNICNLRCPLCVTGLGLQKKSKGWMKWDMFINIIDKIPSGKQVQLYSWGESLLHKDIGRMLEYCNTKGLHTEISSNLSLRSIDQILESLVKNKLNHLIVSFDGVNQEDYSRYRVGGNFRLVIDNITKIAKFKEKHKSLYPRITLQYLKNKFTTQQPNIIKENIKKWGADDMAVLDMTTVFKDNDFKKAEEWLSEEYLNRDIPTDIDETFLYKTCLFLYKYMLIDHDGSMPPCCFTTDPVDDFEKWDHNKSIRQMYNSSKYKSARRLFKTKRVDGKIPCNNCSLYFSYKNKSGHNK